MQAAPQAAAGWIRVEEPVEDRFQLTVAGLLGCSSPKARKFEWHRVYCIVASGTLRWSAREGGTPLCSVPCSLYSVRVDARLGPNNVELTVQEFGTAPRSVIRLHADSPAKAARWAHVIRANGAVSDDADAAAAAASGAGPGIKGFKTDFYDKAQITLTDAIRGFFLVPDEGSWNYFFQGVKFAPTIKYGLKLDVPLEFYHERHRPAHFLQFAAMEEEDKDGALGALGDAGVDRDDAFA